MNNHNLFYEINRIYGRTALRLIRRHERCSSKLARYTNHLTFLTRCIKNRVVPKDLRVRPPVPTKGARRIAELASMRFLRERIRLTQKAKGDVKKEAESTAESITSALSANDANRILEQIKTNTQRVFNTTKDRQKQKFEKLMQEKQAAVSPVDTPYVDKTNWVINLSSRSLSDAEIALLKKGLNFAVTPANIPATEIIAKVETAVRQLDAEQADTVRRAVNGILQQAEPPEPNITKEMRDALKSLKEDESIMVLPADKGRASVVMDTATYQAKISTLIENGPYQLLNKDPTDRLTRKLSEKLLTLKRNGHLSEAVYNKIRPRHKQPPRIYGLPKIHKADVPLRPIVSCVNTFAYDLSAYLANILSPLTGKSEFTVTNSAHFVSTISSETIRDNEIMVSFDVESLFTNVPIDAAVQAALQRLENDPSLADRTTLTPAQIADLLTFVLRSTYFQYNGSIYEQKDGAAMGSPVSAVIANLYMESFEEQAITTSSYKPTIWKRYVDDTFTILDRGNVDDFLQHLNNQQPSIRFTMETENNNKLAFLDTAVSREPDGRLTTSVYRKPTHTDQYLAYDSHHPQSVKRGIVKCLYERAKRLVTKPSVISEEKKHLSSVLVSNGYPFSFLQKLTKTGRPNDSTKPAIEFKATAVLPYVKGVSEQLRRSLQQQGVRAVFKSETTLRSHLVRPKDAVNPAKQDGVVYRIPCECGKVYIGETGRPMQDRIKEHDRDIRFARTETSAVSEHAHNTGHKPLWNEVKFIDRDPHYYTRRVKEAIHIRLHPDNINRDSGIEIPEAWMPTIKKHNNRRAVRQRTAEGARNSEDRNAPIRAAENQPTTAEHHAL